jgi:putative hydrolase of the HAD superfamily
MKPSIPTTHLFIDIGGVLLTNGWDRHARKRAAEYFQIDPIEMEDLHHLVFESFEVGKFTLDEYMNLVVFNKKRAFTEAQFRQFMFDQSKPYPEMLELAQQLKVRHGLKVVVISNEARELTEYRIRAFHLDSFVDTFISSCYVGLRKPDPQIFKLAMDVSQAKPDQILYMENTPLYIQIAESLKIPSLLHIDYASTVTKLKEQGFS